MADTQLEALSEHITSAHARIQQQHEDINPVVGVNRQMRKSGIPADAMTIDCLKTNRRILIILHDEQPDIVHYQFGMREQDPGPHFDTLPFEQAHEQQLYDWIVSYFSEA
jgi:hypothetical protein